MNASFFPTVGTLCLAFLAFALGTVAPSAATIDDRSVVLSYVASDLFSTFFQHPGAVGSYEDPIFPDEFLESSGALSVGLERVGSPDDKVVAAALVARAFILRGDRDGALSRLKSALAAAAALGWDDRRANGILRDLAWLTGKTGDAEATDYARRAETCPTPCAEDAIAAFHGEAMLAAASGPGIA